MDSESPLMSSPVAMQSVAGTGEDVGTSKGNPIREDVRGAGSVSFSSGEYRRVDDEPPIVCSSRHREDSSSKAAGIRNVGIFLFKSGGKSKRRRKFIRRSHRSPEGMDGGVFSGSSSSNRPSKRNRAQVVDSDPFSLNRLLDQNVEVAIDSEAHANVAFQEASLDKDPVRGRWGSDSIDGAGGGCFTGGWCRR
ncbi:hypothetical protein Hanom_Chr10g00893251 [Helianthus anomalus]